jgi:hypothetical protein
MAPREKARELIDKMYYCQRYVDGEKNYIHIPLEAYKRAKQCALRAVDEILNLMNDIWMDSFTVGESDNKFWNYWQEVKEEIDKLLKQHNNP